MSAGAVSGQWRVAGIRSPRVHVWRRKIPSREILNPLAYPPQAGGITTSTVTVIIGGRPLTRIFPIMRP